jgi:hypothetical protein
MSERKEVSGAAPVKAEKLEERDFVSKIRIKRDQRHSVKPKSRLGSRITYYDIYVNGKRTMAYVYVYKGQYHDMISFCNPDIKDQVLFSRNH